MWACVRVWVSCVIRQPREAYKFYRSRGNRNRFCNVKSLWTTAASSPRRPPLGLSPSFKSHHNPFHTQLTPFPMVTGLSCALLFCVDGCIATFTQLHCCVLFMLFRSTHSPLAHWFSFSFSTRRGEALLQNTHTHKQGWFEYVWEDRVSAYVCMYVCVRESSVAFNPSIKPECSSTF